MIIKDVYIMNVMKKALHRKKIISAIILVLIVVRLIIGIWYAVNVYEPYDPDAFFPGLGQAFAFVMLILMFIDAILIFIYMKIVEYIGINIIVKKKTILFFVMSLLLVVSTLIQIKLVVNLVI